MFVPRRLTTSRRRRRTLVLAGFGLRHSVPRRNSAALVKQPTAGALVLVLCFVERHQSST